MSTGTTDTGVKYEGPVDIQEDAFGGHLGLRKKSVSGLRNSRRFW